MHKLMTSDSIKSTEVSPVEAEHEVTSPSLWSVLEPVTVNINLIRHDDKCPQPGQSFKNVESIKWGPESLVVQVSSLALLTQILVVLRGDEVRNRSDQVHQPDRQKQISSIHVDQVSEDNDERGGEVGGDVPHEFRRFLDDQDLTVVSSALDQSAIMCVLLLRTFSVLIDLRGLVRSGLGIRHRNLI